MKKPIFTLLAAGTLALAACAYNQIQGIYVNGSTTTTMTVGGTNVIVSRVEAANTNTFNLSSTIQAQGNTNQWPACPLVGGGGLNDRYLSLTISFQASASDSTAITFRLAGNSGSQTNWDTAFKTFTLTPNGVTTVTFTTNIDTFGTPFISLYTVENTHATAAISNLTITASSKPGI